MRKLIVMAMVAAALAIGVAPAAADVRVSMRDGRVTVIAKEATLRQILAEWARVGQARIVNGEQVAGGPMTIELTDVPERQALDILMRSIGGYLAAPRATALPNASFFDRIIVLPTAAAPRSATAGSSAPAPLPQPRFQPNPVDDDAAFQRAPFAPPTPQPAGAAPPIAAAPQLTPAPAFQSGPPVQLVPAPATSPIPGATVPLGSSRPGVIAAPPQQPQPNQPGRP
jgi:hypothetical protein